MKNTIDKQGYYLIAEIGQNHQGDLSIAKKMVDDLKKVKGVSAIKTAKRDLDTCLTEKQKNMPYDNKNSFGKTYLEHRKALELSNEDFLELKKYSEESGFDFISSFTDINSLNFLVNDCKVKVLKIASQRSVDIELLKEVAKTKLPVILSTGMCSQEDVDAAINILKGNKLYLMQCTSSYPCEEKDLNLNVISMYLKKYKGIVDYVGFSGHHNGIAPDMAAYMLGSKIFERHFTLDRSMKGTDHSASLEIRGFELICKYLKQIQDSLGSYDKKILTSEMSAINKLRSDLKK